MSKHTFFEIGEIQVIKTVGNEEGFVIFQGNENFDSDVFLSPAGARDLAAKLLKAADEVEKP